MLAPVDQSVLDLQYRPDLNILTARWLQVASLPELQAAHQALQASGRDYGTYR
ncbi:hypothetical protein LGH70_08745 [Hymenobacter sp. BT635]|uniref:Uncharacterized protein n=1 Tax=Hymenobacter nitidus TaxID=2880929 RepID=A0ABS8AB75_9BACT|nr:hypothetical protein [Hymenobacter nitidus]MCB2377666.1 hypothetical protein [Hymenobacter nitidus]